MGIGQTRTEILRSILKSLNGTVKTITRLERDPPITELAHMQMQGGFRSNDLLKLEIELFQLLKRVNLYRSTYWKLEGSIKQSFLRLLKTKRYLPSLSLEVDSLKNALPEAIIKGDERIWIYSFDHYMGPISVRVGRKKEDAPKGECVYNTLSKKYSDQVEGMVKISNDLLPDIHVIKAKVHSLLKDPQKDWDQIHVKKPKVTLVERPIRKSVILKRPLPLPKKGKMPRKRVLRKPDIRVIGPEDAK